MKWMVASDIHGAAECCRKMLEAMEREQADKLLLLGDLLYHGPRNDLPEDYAPKEVITMLNGAKERLLCVRGNCDTEVDQMVLEFPIMAEYAVVQLGERMIFASHGHHINPSNPPYLKQGEILLNGHTHVPAYEKQEGGWLYLNPGSVSIPKNDSEKSYLILCERECRLNNLSGNQIWMKQFGE
ncbi:phosphodiesterase [Bariatricus massiliensis]|uniref:Phosphoesterase n=1 Tax=Bariatricus massiliensis TaxID=1745713 RepID=A0ABS8DCR1_9FIRM|nr:phosphodiesterase [Bariatricus massiliensis]MCB7303402.1 phosphodiesterase [Bariatricus massiliensis]MCB7373534.1 phosphodiesterase [Bariatricus massiliensis]MCB7386204.1 phosphodiesterase [Bariatricus massiliensis]MCB7410366.1 phosphodiesterase [Bariatricus massiliensis]MCQ5252350.1 phosphodiesterase [Bariatricus massiliensis]